ERFWNNGQDRGLCPSARSSVQTGGDLQSLQGKHLRHSLTQAARRELMIMLQNPARTAPDCRTETGGGPTRLPVNDSDQDEQSMKTRTPSIPRRSNCMRLVSLIRVRPAKLSR